MINKELVEEQFGFGWHLKNEKATYELIDGILSPFDKKLLFSRSLWLCWPWYFTVQIIFLWNNWQCLGRIHSYPRNRYQRVNVKIKITITG